MTDQHTTKAFDVDLQDLARMVAEMGGLAEKQVADSVDALAKRDTALAQRVAMADANIDTLQNEIEEKAVLTIARRQPMAVDLREVVGALRFANDLERAWRCGRPARVHADHRARIGIRFRRRESARDVRPRSMQAKAALAPLLPAASRA